MGVRCRQATAMLNTEPHRIEGRFASVLQAASPRVFSAGPGLSTTPLRSHCSTAGIADAADQLLNQGFASLA